MRCHANRFTQLVGLVAIFAAGLVAGPPPITITDAGYFATVVDANGYPSFERIAVVDLRTGKLPPITPEDPVPEDPPTRLEPPEGIGADIAEWATAVGDFDGAQRYAILMETVRDGVKGGQVKPPDVFEVLRKSADAVFTDPRTGVLDNKWSDFRRRLSDHFVSIVSAGEFDDPVQIRQQLEKIRVGLLYAFQDAPSIREGDALGVISKVNSIIDQESGK